MILQHRLLAGTPGVGSAGTYNITFLVTDSGGLSDSETIMIVVAPPLNSPPQLRNILQDQSVMTSTSTDLYVIADDPDGQSLTYSAQLSNGNNISTVGGSMSSVLLGDLDGDGVSFPIPSTTAADLAIFQTCFGNI